MDEFLTPSLDIKGYLFQTIRLSGNTQRILTLAFKMTNTAERKFFDFVTNLENRLGMYVPAEDYSGLSSIILGFDLGTGGNVLKGFQEWLVENHGVPQNFSWTSGILYLCELPTQANVSLSREEQHRAISRMFHLLSEYSKDR